MFIHPLLWARLGDAKIYKAQDPQSCSEACPLITTQSGDSRGGLVDVSVEPGADCDYQEGGEILPKRTWGTWKEM